MSGTRRRLAGLLAAALLASAAHAAPTPAELAADADLVALAVVEQVDYQKTRDFPSSGSAFLRILIAYRGAEQGDWIEVKEQGLGETRCYYPEPDPFAFEGARFFVLLSQVAGDQVYRGTAPGCRIPVLVTSDNRYAVRYPVDGLDLPEAAAETLAFQDPAAIVDATDFTSRQQTELVERYHAVPMPASDALAPGTERFIYTRGIPLGVFRRLLELEPETGRKLPEPPGGR